MSTKDEIRKTLKTKRLGLSGDYCKKIGKLIVPRFSSIPRGVDWLLYAAVQNEVPTEALFKWIKKRGDRAYFPRIEGNNLAFHLVNDMAEMKKGEWTLEPSERAPKHDQNRDHVIVVPGVAFSPQGYRLGFGKGFYDRYLKKNTQGARWALAYDFQVVLNGWEPHDHDEHLDYVITLCGVWSGSPLGNLKTL